MARRLSAPSRLVAASLIDWTGTGFYVAVSAIFLTRSVGLTASEAGLALAGVYGLGGVATEILGPVLVTSVVLALGSAGWLVLATVFVVAGAVTPPAARRALARPVAPRRPSGPRGPVAQTARLPAAVPC
jgi:hypothetical protein